MFHFYCNFFKKFRDTAKYEKLENDFDSLYLGLWEQNLDDVFPLEERDEWNAMRSRVCTGTFTARPTDNFSHGLCCNMNKKQDKREPVVF